MSPFLFALVLVRIVGIYLIAEGAVQLGQGAVSTTLTLIQTPSPGTSGISFANAWLWPFLYAAVYIGAGLVLVLRATRFARIASRGTYAEGHCQRCGYNLAPGGLSKCPECGDTEVKGE